MAAHDAMEGRHGGARRHCSECRPPDGPARVPGQAAVRPPRRARARGPPAAHRRGGGRRRRRDRLSRAWSRPRSRSAAAARPAGSRSPRTATRSASTPRRSSGMDIRGLTVHELWIEDASEIASEYYASVIFDRSAKAPLLMLSTKGGMDIEEVADEDPDAIAAPARRPAARLPGLPRPAAGVRGGRRRRRRPAGRRDAREALRGVRRRGGDARRGQPADRHAASARSRRSTRRSRSTTTRCSATPRTPSCATSPSEDPQERMAKERGLTYVKLDGDIGILGNGAGPGRCRRSTWSPRRAARRPTSSTPAAARRPRRSPARSR